MCSVLFCIVIVLSFSFVESVNNVNNVNNEFNFIYVWSRSTGTLVGDYSRVPSIVRIPWSEIIHVFHRSKARGFDRAAPWLVAG